MDSKGEILVGFLAYLSRNCGHDVSSLNHGASQGDSTVQSMKIQFLLVTSHSQL